MKKKKTIEQRIKKATSSPYKSYKGGSPGFNMSVPGVKNVGPDIMNLGRKGKIKKNKKGFVKSSSAHPSVKKRSTRMAKSYR